MCSYREHSSVCFDTEDFDNERIHSEVVLTLAQDTWVIRYHYYGH